jgi:hypothetical protein
MKTRNVLVKREARLREEQRWAKAARLSVPAGRSTLWAERDELRFPEVRSPATRRASLGTHILGAGKRLTNERENLKDLPPDLWHGDPDEVFVHLWDCLHVRGEDLGMFCQVDKESITCPPTLDLHHLKRRPPQQVLER